MHDSSMSSYGRYASFAVSINIDLKLSSHGPPLYIPIKSMQCIEHFFGNITYVNPITFPAETKTILYSSF